MNFIPGQEPDGTDKPEGEELTDALSQSGETAFVTSDGGKKKAGAGTLGLVGLLAICAGGTYFMYLRGGPKSADAAEDTQAAQIDTFLDEGQKHVTLMQQVLKNTPQVVQRFRESTADTQVPLAALRTNPFRMSAEKPEPVVDTEAGARRRREEERAAAAQAVEGLTLKLILFGRRPAAMINGRTVTAGDEIDGFVVEQIRQDAVVVRQGVYRFELKMKK